MLTVLTSLTELGLRESVTVRLLRVPVEISLGVAVVLMNDASRGRISRSEGPSVREKDGLRKEVSKLASAPGSGKAGLAKEGEGRRKDES